MRKAPSINTSLLSSEIHIYAIDLLHNHEEENLLDHYEKSRAKAFKFDLHRLRYIRSHIGLRKVLINYTQINPEISIDPHNKPYLKQFPHIHFNLSHSEDIAICAITLDIPVGIDVEYTSREINTDEIAKRFFPHDQFDDFFQHWARKEAYLKCIGKGIVYGLDKKIPEDYKIYEFSPAQGYTAALVYQGEKEIREICGKISGH